MQRPLITPWMANARLEVHWHRVKGMMVSSVRMTR